MSQAEELLNSIEEEVTSYTTNPETEEHIVIGEDRFITVPDALKRIAVQYDHKVETVTFDCPRYWDGYDLTLTYIYVNYLKPDKTKGVYLAKNVRIDDNDSSIFHFDWIIGRELTSVNGPISFLVCAIQTNEEGYRSLQWNSEINNQMTISNGLECTDVLTEDYPDIITDLLTRMDNILLGDGTILDETLTEDNLAASAKAVGDRFNAVENRIDANNESIDNINYVLNNEVVKEESDPTVPDWAKQPAKPSYSSNELKDGYLIALKDGMMQTNLNSEMISGKKIDELKTYVTSSLILGNVVATEDCGVLSINGISIGMYEEFYLSLNSITRGNMGTAYKSALYVNDTLIHYLHGFRHNIIGFFKLAEQNGTKYLCFTLLDINAIAGTTTTDDGTFYRGHVEVNFVTINKIEIKTLTNDVVTNNIEQGTSLHVSLRGGRL